MQKLATAEGSITEEFGGAFTCHGEEKGKSMWTGPNNINGKGEISLPTVIRHEIEKEVYFYLHGEVARIKGKWHMESQFMCAGEWGMKDVIQMTPLQVVCSNSEFSL